MKWQEAIEDEMQALLKNNTWTAVPLTKGKRTIGSKWVFAIKKNSQDKSVRYFFFTARRHRFFETFAPVICY